MGLVNPQQSNPNDTIEASDVNTPVNQLAAVINGNVDSTNISDNSITTNKIADANVTSTKINFGGGGAGVWWEEIGRTTLTAVGDTISVGVIPSRRYLKVMFIAIQTGIISPYIKFNNDGSNNYNYRYLVNYASASGSTSQPAITLNPDSSANDIIGEIFIDNIAAQEKLVTAHVTGRGGAGPTAQATSIEVSGKWANTAAVISQIDLINNGGAGDFAIGSEVVVLGHN